jgi:hypothetical protein
MAVQKQFRRSFGVPTRDRVAWPYGRYHPGECNSVRHFKLPAA